MKISVAIDGPSGAGKSTLARMAAKHFGYIYVDTGAIYRTVGLYVYRSGIDPKDTAAVAAVLDHIGIELAYNSQGTQQMFLNGEDVSDSIRTPEISMYASAVSSIPEVRKFLLDMQRELAVKNSVIMDGRDIGTVVLPKATVKIFLTASPEKRAERRFAELRDKGMTVSFEEVLKDMNKRDENDSQRDIAPLRPAEDAVIIDTSELDLNESLAAIIKCIEAKINE